MPVLGRTPALLLGLLPVQGAVAPAAARGSDLNRMALEWVRGRFASPGVCEVDGAVQRSLRRLIIQPGPRSARPPVDKLSFHGFDTPDATRCMNALGVEQPEIHGSLQFTLPGASRPDLAQADFQRALREPGGFDFDVTSGRLRFTDWSDARASRLVDLRGGTLRIRRVRRGTDAARILAEFDTPQKLTLELVPPGGEPLHFELILYDFR